jgi:hypothetical protein
MLRAHFAPPQSLRRLSNPKFHDEVDSTLLIPGEIGQDSVSNYWRQVEPPVGLRLQGCGSRHLLEGRSGLIRFQAIGHVGAAG